MDHSRKWIKGLIQNRKMTDMLKHNNADPRIATEIVFV